MLPRPGQMRNTPRPTGRPTAASAVVVAALLLTAWLTVPGPSAARAADDAGSREYALKAAYIYNFVQFVEWPDAAFADAKAPVVITVLGDNPFGTALEQATRGKTVRGRDIAVRYAPDAAAARGSHVLFVAAPFAAQSAATLKAAGGPSVLTVSDAEGFCAAGGCIRFFAEDNRIRFEINPAAANRAGVKLQAKLLQLARLYKEN